MSEHSCSSGSCNTGSTCGSGCDSQKDLDRFLAEQEIKQTLSKIKHKIPILSGKGGVGKSTICAALASRLAHDGFKVGILDVDLHGPSIPGMFGVIGQRPDMSEDGKMLPVNVVENLSLISVGFLLQERNDALIWRGPLKIGVIEQFIKDVEWGELDFLLIDCPPGTGDEPLTVLQTITDSESILITTPQEVAVEDVIKSVTFCKKLNNPILGIIENMSAVLCPHCNKEIILFRGRGGEKISEESGSPLLAQLPVLPTLVESADNGTVLNNKDSLKTFRPVVDMLLNEIKKSSQEKNTVIPKKEGRTVIAVPCSHDDKMLASHFGHCDLFNFYEIDETEKKITDILAVTPPEHQPGVIPSFLAEKGVNIVITGGIGEKAVEIFNKRGIEVISGVKPMKAEQLIEQYLNDTLEITGNTCSH